MQVFVFDWMAYGQSVDHFRVNGEMPKLGRKHFDPQVAVEPMVLSGLYGSFTRPR